MVGSGYSLSALVRFSPKPKIFWTKKSKIKPFFLPLFFHILPKSKCLNVKRLCKFKVSQPRRNQHGKIFFSRDIWYFYFLTFFEFLQMHKPVVKTAYSRWQKRIFNKINHPAPQVFLGILLLMSLFLAESWILGNGPDSTNDALYSILLAIFIIFCGETIVLSFVQEGYFNSFFFYMDIIGKIFFLIFFFFNH